MNKKQLRLNAVIAERLFGVAILLLLVTVVIDFIFVTDYLKSQASTTEDLRQKSEASDSDITKLKSADAWLKRHKDTVERTGAVVAQSKLYQYQNQIIEDFNDYAGQAGLPVSGYSFSASSGSSGTLPAAPGASSTSVSAPSSPSATGVAAGTSSAKKIPAGLNSTNVTVTFGDKVGYQNFLTMLRLLEQNVTRMQVTDISLSPDLENPQIILNPNVTVTVYTR